MNQPEAERLLGGYAAGILTATEKQVLFSAALAHQDVFDALMDEEALRELLADPEVRQKLLQVLADPGSAKVHRFWGMPGALGLAASLFLLVTTGLMLWRHPASRMLIAPPPPLAEQIPPAKGSSQVASPGSSKAPAPSLPAPAAKRAKLAAAPPALAPAAERVQPSVPEAEASGASAFDAAVPARKAQAVQDQAAANALEETVKRQAPASLGAVKRSTEDQVQAVPTKPLQLAPVVERLAEGGFRLRVTWGPEGYLYVVKRTASGATLLPAAGALPVKGGATVSTFLFSPEDLVAVDVYLLKQEAAEPAALPASGPVPGIRRRVYPD
jgi:hypothetical protein